MRPTEVSLTNGKGHTFDVSGRLILININLCNTALN
jgi:hypothetical protein